MTIDLIRPTTDLFDSWAAAVAEFGDVHVDGSGLRSPVSPDRETLDALIEKALLHADTSAELPEGLVHEDLLWIVDEGEVIGFLSFRHELNAWLREAGGHIGYSVRASRRRQGHASAALALGLDRARAMGLDRVLLRVRRRQHRIRAHDREGGRRAAGRERPVRARAGDAAAILDRPAARRVNGCPLGWMIGGCPVASSDPEEHPS